MNGVTQLGYLAFAVSDVRAWEGFATGVLGTGIGERLPSGGFTLRIDERARRFFVEPPREGEPPDDVAAFGWEAADESALHELAGRLERAGAPVREGSAAERDRRGVAALLASEDPAGNPLELFCGAETVDEPFVSGLVRSGFVAGDLGLGHAVISARDKAESTGFYTEVLGLRLSDHIVCEVYGYPVNISFFHANARHHSLAFGEKQRKRIHHFMVEVGSFDDVGLAYDRALRGGVRIAQTLGRHPNDRMFSFYAHTPSRFQFELGWGGRQVDDATWEPTTYDCISEWGHHPPPMLAKLFGGKP